MEIKKEDACQALVDGKLVIVYFGNNGDYEYSHLVAPVEVRLFGDLFCTYTSKGVHTRPLKGKNIMEALIKKFDDLDIHPVFILNERPAREPMKK